MAAVCARIGCHQLAGTCNPSKRPGWSASVTQSTRNGSALCSLRPFCPSVDPAALSAASWTTKQQVRTSSPCKASLLGYGSAARCDASESTRRRPKYVPNRIHDPDYVTISDTTLHLREGEKSPAGVTMTSKENSKLDIAGKLTKLTQRVDIIEAGLGFPIAAPDDLEAVRKIAQDVGNSTVNDQGYVPVICGLARCSKADTNAACTCGEAVKTFSSSSNSCFYSH